MQLVIKVWNETHSGMEPVLTHYTLDHLVLDLYGRGRGEEREGGGREREGVWVCCTAGQSVTHLIFAVWVRSIAGAVQASEVVVVPVLRVQCFFVL